LNEKSNIDAPYTVCRRCKDLISVPDRNTGNLDEWFVLEIVVVQMARRRRTCAEQSIAKRQQQTGRKKSRIKMTTERLKIPRR
jgi:hypothetical protein